MYSGPPGVEGETSGAGVGEAPEREGPLLTLFPLQSKHALRKGFVTLVCPSQPVMAHGGALDPSGYVSLLIRFQALRQSVILMRRIQTCT